MSKTPYEIRKELLDMAYTILVYNTEQKNIADREDFMLQRDVFVNVALGGREDKESGPKFPKGLEIQKEEIIDLAKYLNDFVSNDSK